MPVFRLDLHYKRTLTAFIEAEDESDIDQFLTDNSDFDMLEDYPELVEHDESVIDPDNDLGDYELTEVSGITAGWRVTPGAELIETE